MFVLVLVVLLVRFCRPSGFTGECSGSSVGASREKSRVLLEAGLEGIKFVRVDLLETTSGLLGGAVGALEFEGAVAAGSWTQAESFGTIVQELRLDDAFLAERGCFGSDTTAVASELPLSSSKATHSL